MCASRIAYCCAVVCFLNPGWSLLPPLKYNCLLLLFFGRRWLRWPSAGCKGRQHPQQPRCVPPFSFSVVSCTCDFTVHPQRVTAIVSTSQIGLQPKKRRASHARPKLKKQTDHNTLCVCVCVCACVCLCVCVCVSTSLPLSLSFYALRSAVGMRTPRARRSRSTDVISSMRSLNAAT